MTILWRGYWNIAAERRFLLDGDVTQIAFDRPQRRRQSGRPCANNDHIVWLLVAALEPGDIFNCPGALPRRLVQQSHAAEFARNEDAGYVGLEMRIKLRNVHAAFFGAENELDRIVRTGLFAGAMADADSRVDQHSFAVDHAECTFRTHRNATARSQAQPGVDFGMQGGRLRQSRFDAFIEYFDGRALLLDSATHVKEHDQCEEQQIKCVRSIHRLHCYRVRVE